MRRLSCAVFAVAVAMLQPAYAQVQGQWTSTGTMQTGRELNAQVPVAGGKVLSIGGADKSGNTLNSAEVYSSTSGKWTLTGSMAQARDSFPAVVLTNGKVLVSGGVGTGNVILSSAELYDPTTGAWSSAGSLSVARAAHPATLLPRGKGLGTGGGIAPTRSPATAARPPPGPTSNTWPPTGRRTSAPSPP